MDYIAHQTPLSMGFPWQEYWSGLPFPSSGDLPDPGMEPALVGRFFTTETPGKPTTKDKLLNLKYRLEKNVYNYLSLRPTCILYINAEYFLLTFNIL